MKIKQLLANRLLLSTLLVLLCPLLAHATTYYVNKAGNDGNSCSTAQSPVDSNAKLSIGAGTSCLLSGDTLIVGDGTYNEKSLTITAGTLGAPTTMMAENRNLAIIKPAFAGGFNAIIWQVASYATFDGIYLDCTNFGSSPSCTPFYASNVSNLTIQNGTATGSRGDGTGGGEASGIDISQAYAGNHIIRNMDLVNNGAAGSNADHQIYMVGSDNLVENNRISGSIADGEAITLHDVTQTVSGNIIRNNIIFDNAGEAILLSREIVGAEVYNNIIYNNAAEGIYLYDGSMTGVVLAFNTIYGNGTSDGRPGIILNNSGQSGTVVRNNILYGNGTNTVFNSGSGTVASNNLIGIDPFFVNAPAGDFHVLSTSPARGAGLTISSPSITTDFDNVIRVSPGPTIGALEAPSGSNPLGPLSEDLESYTVTTTICSKDGGTGWTQEWQCPTGSATVETAGGGLTGKELRITSTSDVYLRRLFTARTGEFTIQFKLSSSITNPNSFGYGVNLIDSNGSYQTDTYFNSSNNIVSSTQTLVAGFTIDIAYPIAINFNTITNPGQYRTSVNGGATYTAWENCVSSCTSIAGIEIYTYSTNAHIFRLDDINALTGAGSITGVNPNSGPLTTAGLNVVLTGSATSWVNGTSICSFSGTGVVVNSTTVASATSATCNITIQAGAALGLRSISMTTSGAVSNIVDGFTVLPAPAISVVSPNSGTRTQTGLNITVTGTNTQWLNGISAGSFSSTGITVNSTTVSNTITAVLNITIAPTATLGLRTVSVNTSGSIASLANSFTVNDIPTKLAFTAQPPASVNSGATLSSVSVAVQFSNSTTSTTSTNSITLALCGGSPTGTLGGTLTRSAVAGVATFTNLTVTATIGGAGYSLCATATGLTSATSNSFTVVGLGPPTKVVYTTQPPAVVNSAAVISTVRLAVQFSNSTTDTSSTASVTIALCGGSPAGTLSGTTSVNAVAGIASFTDLVVTSGVGGAGYSLCATSSGLTGATSNSFTVNVPALPSTKLGFTIQPPSSTLTGATLPSVAVAVQFASGATNTTSTASVTVTLCSGTGTLTGTRTVAAVAGIATFSTLIVSASSSASGLALCAASTGLTSATSTTFNVVVPPPPATKLGFTAQPPTSINSGVVFPSPVLVAVQLATGATDTTSTSSITVGLCSGSPAGTLGGTLTVVASAGIATFSNLSVTTTTGGTGYSLCAFASSLTSATSNSFTVNVPASTCETNPVVIKNISWPSGQSGSRSLGWNSNGFSIASVRFIYPGTALFTDTRGCQVTMTK